MKFTRFLYVLFSFAALALFSGCATGGGTGAYRVTAYAPKDPNNVRVKVSTSTQHVYVMEGDRCLMAVQGCVGKNGSTPMGDYRIQNKIKNKRRISQPDAGYPMAYWCEFKPAYGFHEGFVWSEPRTHGCIRLHKEAAARLFALVKVGTPVNLSTSQPEDATHGKKVQRLDQRNDPDPPRALLMSSAFFRDPPGPLLQ